MRKIIVFCLGIFMLVLMSSCKKDANRAIVGKWVCVEEGCDNGEMATATSMYNYKYEFTSDGAWRMTDTDGEVTKGIYAINDSLLVLGSEGVGRCYVIRELKHSRMTLADNVGCFTKWKK